MTWLLFAKSKLTGQDRPGWLIRQNTVQRQDEQQRPGRGLDASHAVNVQTVLGEKTG